MSEGSGGFDVQGWLQAQDVTVKPTEHPDDRRARLARDGAAFRGALAMIGLVFLASLALAAMADDPADRRWAQSVVTLILGGVLGYAFKRG